MRRRNVEPEPDEELPEELTEFAPGRAPLTAEEEEQREHELHERQRRRRIELYGELDEVVYGRDHHRDCPPWCGGSEAAGRRPVTEAELLAKRRAREEAKRR